MTTRQVNVQHVKSVTLDMSKDNIGAGNGQEIKLPAGAILLRLLVLTVTAFNSATTTTTTVSDGTTTFANAVDAKTTGSETVTGVPKHYPTGGTITATMAETGAAATAGRQLIVAEYVMSSGGEEVYG